ncbi:HlyD family secretion protein [Aquisalimonas sp.]|uniref:HlyD family secretion protein n=1 Tax=Aquisalimonas sp. TaxID=1872621 RepID=UPI0025B902BC|nr:HlyD family secretion protein [Aquisalimonas sp.]
MSGQPVEQSGTRAGNGHGGKIVLAVVVLVILAAGAGYWLYERLLYVHEIDARVEADMITVASRLPGWLETMGLSQGDAVAKGDVLVRLDPREAERRMAVLEAREEALRRELDQVDAELNLARARDESRIERARRRVAVAQAELERRERQREKAVADLERVRGMAEDAMVSEQEVDDARHALRLAESDVRSTRAALEEARAAVDEARAEQAHHAVLAATAATLEARVQELRAEQEEAQLGVSDRKIRSPIDGVVAETFVNAGEHVQAGQNLVMVHEPGRVWVKANIRETDIAQVAEGQSVRIQVDGYRGEDFSGRVERIGSAATSEFALLPNPNPSGNFTKVTQRIPVRIAFDDPDARLRPGMMVEVRIDVRD